MLSFLTNLFPSAPTYKKKQWLGGTLYYLVQNKNEFYWTDDKYARVPDSLSYGSEEQREVHFGHWVLYNKEKNT